MAAADSEEEGDGVEDVADNELDAQLLDVEVVTPPAKETIAETKESENGKQTGNNHTADFDTKPRAVSKSVKRVGGFGITILWNSDLIGSQDRLRLSLWVAHFGDGERGGNTHHTG